VDWHGKQVINMWITSFVASILIGMVGGAGMCAGGMMGSETGALIALIAYGVVMLLAVAYSLALMVIFIMAMFKAKAGIYYKYPLTMRLIK